MCEIRHRSPVISTFTFFSPKSLLTISCSKMILPKSVQFPCQFPRDIETQVLKNRLSKPLTWCIRHKEVMFAMDQDILHKVK